MLMLSEEKETSLVGLAKEDDDKALAELYNYYFPRIYNYVHYRVADFYTADDLTSQVFEKMFNKLSYYHLEKAPFSAWLYCIARNTITDYYRRRGRTNSSSLEAAGEVVDPDLDPADIAVLSETREHLRKALTFLTPRERNIIALKFWSGYSNREIAKITGIKESNTGVILFRAMRRLRTVLETQGMNSYE